MFRFFALLVVFALVTDGAAIPEPEPEPEPARQDNTLLTLTAVVEACEDKEEECAGWARDNFCETQRDLMSYYCAATCGICTTVAETAEIFTEVVETIVEGTAGYYGGREEEYYGEDSSNDDSSYYGEEEDSYYGEEEESYYGEAEDESYYGEDESYYGEDESYYGEDESYYGGDTEGGSYESYDYDASDLVNVLDTITPAITNRCAGEVKNGELKEMSPSSYGFVECDTGFTRNGAYYIYCNDQGLITGEVATCERKCSEIEVEGGNIEPPEDERQGWIYVSCNEGYTLEGNAWNWCDKGVVDYMPTCTGGAPVDVVSEDMGDSSDYNYNYDSSYDTYDEYDSSSDLDYDTPESSTDSTVIDGGIITGGDYNGCALETVVNGDWTDPYGTSTYWILDCNTGFVKTGGDEYSYCNEDKTVAGASPECVEDKCGNVQIENGVVSTSGTGSWIWVQVQCESGYTITGSSGAYCDSADGSFSGDIGTCNM